VVVSVRRTGTSTWKPLTVAMTQTNAYEAHFKTKTWMENRAFDVRVSATDSKGNAVVQTTERAFVVGP
jgi:hypothetical protein